MCDFFLISATKNFYEVLLFILKAIISRYILQQGQAMFCVLTPPHAAPPHEGAGLLQCLTWGTISQLEFC